MKSKYFVKTSLFYYISQIFFRLIKRCQKLVDAQELDRKALLEEVDLEEQVVETDWAWGLKIFRLALQKQNIEAPDLSQLI